MLHMLMHMGAEINKKSNHGNGGLETTSYAVQTGDCYPFITLLKINVLKIKR